MSIISSEPVVSFPLTTESFSFSVIAIIPFCLILSYSLTAVFLTNPSSVAKVMNLSASFSSSTTSIERTLSCCCKFIMLIIAVPLAVLDDSGISNH